VAAALGLKLRMLALTAANAKQAAEAEAAVNVNDTFSSIALNSASMQNFP